MKIKSIYLENIKKFGSAGKIFNFSKNSKIHTISGVNGSGKTAIFKAIQVFQKLFFLNQDENYSLHEIYWSSIEKEILRLISSEKAVVDIVFDIEDYSHHLILNIEKNNDIVTYEFESKTPNAYGALHEIWDLNDPKCIVSIIEAGKTFSGFGVDFENIKIQSKKNSQKNYYIQAIFEPENILKNIYEKTVIDHIQYRLDPSRKYDYFRVANKAIKTIIENLEVSNISATKVDGKVVILGRSSKDSIPFDIEDFSAGERTLYLTLLFIFNFPNLGILIIDEPENHLHESLLGKFYNLLLNISLSDSINGWATQLDKDAVLSCGEKLEQLFLVTHSRSLIYSNINYGECLVFNKDNLESTSNTEIEAGLRAAGVSTILTKTLFIEGSSDLNLIESYFIQKGIRVVALGNCTEVIEYFKKIAGVKNSIHGAAFCFAIDSDNRVKSDIEEIRAFDKDFFEQSFVVLERHEIENYLIDQKLLLDCVNPIKIAIGENEMREGGLLAIFKTEAEALKNQSMSKYIASGLSMAVKELITNNITDTRKIATKFDGIIFDHVTDETIISLEARKIVLKEDFEKSWDADWMRLVDGKSFLGRVIGRISADIGIKPSKLEKMIRAKISNNITDYKINELIDLIMVKLNKQIN